MRLFVVIATLFLASLSPPSVASGAISSQYHSQDHLGQYSYGYADPNSQKHESRSADGSTKGAYSYVDGYGHVQSVSYFADPHTGFHVSGTNLPQAPAPLHAVAAPLAYAAYAAPFVHHVPLTPHGVPVDTPEVQHAKAAHFAAHAAARAGHHHLYKRSLWGGHAYSSPWAYAQHIPVIHNGVPVDTPEVQHAKAAHFAAHAQAIGHGAPHAPIDTPEVQHAKAAHFAAHAAAKTGHPVIPHGGYHIPVIHNGVPVETPEVQHAKAAHFAAVAEASAKAALAGPGPEHYAPAHHHGPIHIPVIHNGVPVETPEVQHAKAAHFAAVAEAQSHGHGHGHYDGHYDDGHYDDGQYHHNHGW